MSKKVGHVLQEYVTWTTIINDCADVIKEVPTVLFVIESLLLSGLAEWLTRETGTENVVRRNLLYGNGGDVAKYLRVREINLV